MEVDNLQMEVKMICERIKKNLYESNAFNRLINVYLLRSLHLTMLRGVFPH